MAMSVTYTTFNGQIVYENRGGVESYYAPDTLGSTAALLNASGVVTDTFTYQPYGEIASHVGSSVTPFTYCGTLGYYTDTANSSIYVRARYYRPNLARWQTVDPLWPGEVPYSYAVANPALYVDVSGQYPQHSTRPPKTGPWNTPGCASAGASAASGLSKCFDPKTTAILSAVFECLAYGESDCNRKDRSANNFGLYNIDCKQYNACLPSGCSPCENRRHPSDGCGIFRSDCNTNSTVMLFSFLLHHNHGSLGNILCKNWGVLPCGDRPKQNHKTVSCLRGKGIDIFSMPAPKPLAGCPACQRHP